MANFWRGDLGQFLVAMIAIMAASFCGALIAGSILLAVFL